VRTTTTVYDARGVEQGIHERHSLGAVVAQREHFLELVHDDQTRSSAWSPDTIVCTTAWRPLVLLQLGEDRLARRRRPFRA
jgi:hypothetical protein